MSINPKKKAVKIGVIAIGAIIGLTTIASLIIPNSLSQNPLLASSLSEYYAINQNDVNIIKQLIANDDSITNDKKQELNENINHILTGNVNNKTAPLSIYNKKELSNNLHFQYKVNYDSQISATVDILPIFQTPTVINLIKSVYEENETYLNNINSFRIDLIADLEDINNPKDDNITNIINILKQDINNLYIRELRLQVLRNDIWKNNFNYDSDLTDQLKTDKNNNFKETFKTFTFSIPFLKIDKIKLVNETIPNDLNLPLGSDGKYHTNEFLNIDTNLILTYDSEIHSFVYKKNGNAVFYVSLTDESLKTLQGTFRYDIKNYLKTPSNNPKLSISIPDTNDKSKWIKVNDGHSEKDNVYRPNKTADNITISKDYDSVVFKNQLNTTNIERQKQQWIMFKVKKVNGNVYGSVDGYYLLKLEDFREMITSDFFKNIRIQYRNADDYKIKYRFYKEFVNNKKKLPNIKLFILSDSGIKKTTNFSNYSYYEYINFDPYKSEIKNSKLNHNKEKNDKTFTGLVDKNGDGVRNLLSFNEWSALKQNELMRKYSSIKNNETYLYNGNIYLENIFSLSEDTLKSLSLEDFKTDEGEPSYGDFIEIVKNQTSERNNSNDEIASNLTDAFDENLFKKFISNNWTINNIEHNNEQYSDSEVSLYIKTQLFKDSKSFYDVNREKELQNFQSLPFIENKATYKKYYQINNEHPFNQFLNNEYTLMRILGNIINSNNDRYEVDEKLISLYKTYQNNITTNNNNNTNDKNNEAIIALNLKELKEYVINLINKKLSTFNPLGNVVIKNGIISYVHQVLINQKVLPDDFLAIKDSLNIDRENIKLKLKNITYENWNIVPDNIKNWFKFLGITIRNVLITNIATIGADSNYNRVQYEDNNTPRMFSYTNLNGSTSNLITAESYHHATDMINRINNVSEYPFRLVFDFQLNLNTNTDFYKTNKGNWDGYNFFKGQNVKNRKFINNLLKNSINDLKNVDNVLFNRALNDSALWNVYTRNNNYNNNKIHFFEPYRWWPSAESKVLSYLPFRNISDFSNAYRDYYNYSDINRSSRWWWENRPLESRYNDYLNIANSYRKLFELDNTNFINNNILKINNNLDITFKKIINNSNLFEQMLRNLKYRYGTTTDQYDYFKNTLTYMVNFIKKNSNINLTDLLQWNDKSLKVLNDLSINDILPEKRELFDNLDDKLKDKKSNPTDTYNDSTTAKWLTDRKDQDNVIKLSKDGDNYKLKTNRNNEILYPYFNYAKNWKYETPYNEIIKYLDIEKMKKEENITFSTVPTGLINNYEAFVNSLRKEIYNSNDLVNIKNIKSNELYYDEITRQQIKTWLENFLNNNKNITNKDTLITNLINEIKKKFGIKYTGTKKTWTGRYSEVNNGETPETYNKTIYENVTETYDDYNDRESYWTGNYNYGSTRSFTIKHEIGDEYSQGRADNLKRRYEYTNGRHWEDYIRDEVIDRIRNKGDTPEYYLNEDGDLGSDINGIDSSGNISVEREKIGTRTYTYKIYKTYHINYRAKSKVYSTRPKRKTRTVRRAKTVSATRYKIYDYQYNYETFDSSELYRINKEEIVILPKYENLPYSYKGYTTEFYDDYNELRDETVTEPVYVKKEVETDEWEYYQVKHTITEDIKMNENSIHVGHVYEFKQKHANFRENYEIEQVKNFIRSQPKLYEVVKQNGNEYFSLLEGFSNFENKEMIDKISGHETISNWTFNRSRNVFRKYKFNYYTTERRKKKKTILVQNGTREVIKKVPNRKLRWVYKETSGEENNRINVLTLLWYFENHYFFDDFKINDKLNINQPLTTTKNITDLERQPIMETLIRDEYNIKDILFQSQYNPYVFFKTTSGIKIVKRIPLIDNKNTNTNYNLYTSTEEEIAKIEAKNQKNREIKVNIYTNQNDNIFKDDSVLQNLIIEKIAKEISPNKTQTENLTLIQNALSKINRDKVFKVNEVNLIKGNADIEKEIGNIINDKNLSPKYDEYSTYPKVSEAIKNENENTVNNYLIDENNKVFINYLNNNENGLYNTNYPFIPNIGDTKSLYETFIPLNEQINLWKKKGEYNNQTFIHYYELEKERSIGAKEYLTDYFKNNNNFQDNVVEFDSYIKTLLETNINVFDVKLLRQRYNQSLNTTYNIDFKDIVDNNLWDFDNSINNDYTPNVRDTNVFNIVRYRGAFNRKQLKNYNKPKLIWDDDFYSVYSVNEAFIKLVVIPAIEYVNHIEAKNGTGYDESIKKLFIINSIINIIKIVFEQRKYDNTIMDYVPNLPKKWNTFFNGDLLSYSDNNLNPYLKYIKLWDAKFKDKINTNNNNIKQLDKDNIKKALVDYYNKHINTENANYSFNINSNEISLNNNLLFLNDKNKNVITFKDYGYIYKKDSGKYINEININGVNYGYYTDYKTMWNEHSKADNKAGKDDIVIMLSDNIIDNETLKLQDDYDFTYHAFESNDIGEGKTKFYDQLFGNLLKHQKTLLKIPLDKLINYQRMVQFVYKSDKYGDLLISIDIDNDWSIYIGDTNYHSAANVALDDIKALENYFAFKNNQTNDEKDLSDYQINIQINKHNDNQGLNNQLIASINLKNDKEFNNLHTNQWFNEKGERTNIANHQTIDYYEKIWKTKSDAKPIRFENITPINKQDIDNFFTTNYHSDNSLRNDYNLGSFINNVGLYNLINNKMFDMLNLIFDIDKIKQYQRLAFKDFDSDFDFDKTNQLIDEYINLLQPFNDMVAILTKRNLMMFKTIIPAFKEMINQQGNFKDFNELLTLNSRFAISDVIKKVITDITYTMNSINQIETTFNERYNLSKYKELNLISNYDNILFEYNAVNHFENTNGELNNNLKDTVYYNFKFTPLKELSNYIDYQNHNLIIIDISSLSEAKQYHIRQLVSFFNQQMLNNNKILKMFNDETYRSRIINIMNMFFNTLYYEITNRLLHTFILNDDKLAVLNNLNEALKKVKNYEYQYYDNHKPSGYGSFIITRNSTWNQLQPYMNGRDDQELEDDKQNKGDITEQDYYIKNNTAPRIYPNPKSPYYNDRNTNTITPITTNNFDISNRKLKENVKSDFEYKKETKPIIKELTYEKQLEQLQAMIINILNLDRDYLMLNIFLSNKLVDNENNEKMTVPDLLHYALTTYIKLRSNETLFDNEETSKFKNEIKNVYKKLIKFIVKPYNLFVKTNKPDEKIDKNNSQYNIKTSFVYKKIYSDYWDKLDRFLNNIVSIVNNGADKDKNNAFILAFKMLIDYFKMKVNIINPTIYPRLKTINENAVLDNDEIQRLNRMINSLNTNMNIANKQLLIANETITRPFGFGEIANIQNIYEINEQSTLNIKNLTQFIKTITSLNTYIGDDFIRDIFELDESEKLLKQLKIQKQNTSGFWNTLKAIFRQNFITFLNADFDKIQSEKKRKYIANYNAFVEENRNEFEKWWYISDFENNNNKVIIQYSTTNEYNEIFTFYDWRNVKNNNSIIENENPDEPSDHFPIIDEIRAKLEEITIPSDEIIENTEPRDELPNNPDEPYDYPPDEPYDNLEENNN